MEEVAGFTKKQREWFLQRDGHRCMFRWKNASGNWVRCAETVGLQIHHIVPRGWARENLGLEFEVNSPYNGITLCKVHHVGWKMGRDFQNCVHTDNETARLAFKHGNRSAYRQMHDYRVGLCRKGNPYWNTRFDWMFNGMAKKHTDNFKVPYPQNGNRYMNGRVRVKPAL